MPLPRFLLACCLALGTLAARAASDEVFLFTYFTHNGESGLHLAWSEDGDRWQSLGGGRSFLAPQIGTKEKLMRDPCVVRGPDGTYHMVWTSGWWERGIGYASTKDFLTWSEQKEIPVMAHEPTARNCWAPEIAWDDARGDFVIFWATTIPGRFPVAQGSSEDGLDHRMYFTATKDFATFTPTALFYDPGFNCIDATFVRAQGALWLLIKDETKYPEPKKHLRVARAESPRGPFGPLSPPFTQPGLWVEGPTALEIDGEVRLYFDAYTTKHYGQMRSRDLVTWRDTTAQLQLPDEGTPNRVRHGTVIRVPRALVERLQQATASPAPAPSAR